ncbi:histidine kinase (plasmid) [Streptomyces clavuligerus]|uniref:histidine kinase n=1 Tax=Streptomyces clavuligerus TaxID=1901 RepID=B5GMX3_STRCL|nr:histidine kinase [Streptomyces clavuligerus]EDY47669.1 hypothetical protein SSCG_00697 [Streptomyces clavuligerus]EFG04338.1 Putative two-component system sensor kinase [Streptomyces clavuligerus]
MRPRKVRNVWQVMSRPGCPLSGRPWRSTAYLLGGAVAGALIPVDIGFALPGRVPRAVESAAHFVVCEALAGVAKHSGARRARVGGGHHDASLSLEMRDDGRGGADAAAGSGLTGLADRVSVLDDRLALSSPPGGPTLIHVEFPCQVTEAAERSAQRSPRTACCCGKVSSACSTAAVTRWWRRSATRKRWWRRSASTAAPS